MNFVEDPLGRRWTTVSSNDMVTVEVGVGAVSSDRDVVTVGTRGEGGWTTFLEGGESGGPVLIAVAIWGDIFADCGVNLGGTWRPLIPVTGERASALRAVDLAGEGISAHLGTASIAAGRGTSRSIAGTTIAILQASGPLGRWEATSPSGVAGEGPQVLIARHDPGDWTFSLRSSTSVGQRSMPVMYVLDVP